MTIQATMDPRVQHLLRLETVREKALAVFRQAEQGKLTHFDYSAERLDEAASYVMDIIEVRPGSVSYQLGQNQPSDQRNSATLAPTDTT